MVSFDKQNMGGKITQTQWEVDEFTFVHVTVLCMALQACDEQNLATAVNILMVLFFVLQRWDLEAIISM